MRSNMFIRFIFIKWLNGDKLFLSIKGVRLLAVIVLAWTNYYWYLFASDQYLFKTMIFIQNDNRFFLHNSMSFNRFILINMLKSTIYSISFHIGSQSRIFGTVWQHRHVPPLITDKLSLLVNCRVKLTGMSREDWAGSTTLALKLGGSAPSSGPFWLAACVLGMGQKFCVDTRL